MQLCTEPLNSLNLQDYESTVRPELMILIICFRVRQKDGVAISSSGRVLIASGAGGRHSVSISKVEASDAGKYTVRAFNDFGESRFTATVLVRGQHFNFMLSNQLYLH